MPIPALLDLNKFKAEATILLRGYKIEQYLGKRIDAVIDGGPVPGQPSSVISLLNDEPEIIRKGLGDVEGFL